MDDELFNCTDEFHKCVNTRGSYKCECDQGLYFIDGKCRGIIIVFGSITDFFTICCLFLFVCLLLLLLLLLLSFEKDQKAFLYNDNCPFKFPDDTKSLPSKIAFNKHLKCCNFSLETQTNRLLNDTIVSQPNRIKELHRLKTIRI